MASLSAPATTEQMIQEQLKERDRMMTQSIQALAMDRLRSSVRSLSRETEFQNRPVVGPFSYAPLYIPEYQRWSMGQQRVIGVAPPRMPTGPGGFAGFEGFRTGYTKAASQGREAMERAVRNPNMGPSGYKRSDDQAIVRPWYQWGLDWLKWEESQRNLPA
jgi:hypothetical protein